MILNFGGNVGMFGRMDAVVEEPFKALNHAEYSKGLKGIGGIMEGIENNYVMYELLFDLKWHKNKIDLNNWLSDYAKRRYGKENENINDAWQILRNTVYGKKINSTPQPGTTESILCARPAIEIGSVSTWGTTKFYYEPSELLKAWSLFIKEADKLKDSEGFRYDLLDITRQVLANYAQVLHEKMILAYKNHDEKALNKASKQFIQLIDDQDRLLSSHQNFMLGKWIDEARKKGTNPKEKDLFEFNARTQITTWSFKNCRLHEYAHREWSGLLLDFYKPRWEMFVNYLKEKMDNDSVKEPDYYSFEKEWTFQTDQGYSSEPKRDALKESLRIYKYYYKTISNNY
ncbi:MAG: alpha-N-acetylglucosaminidase C-terminal domain-containing protein [Marinilabiliaceae bacterium]|nr:alpha-N-acetylglucosaminidase C-terminal domain-containing protein [Marinilabiliaceae bacterium]